MTVNINDTKRLGDFVRAHREAAQLTRVQLAELSGVGKTAIFDLEHGKPTVRLQTLLNIADVLNLKLEAGSPLPKSSHVLTPFKDTHA